MSTLGMINIANKNKCKTYFVKPESDVFGDLVANLGKALCGKT